MKVRTMYTTIVEQTSKSRSKAYSIHAKKPSSFPPRSISYSRSRKNIKYKTNIFYMFNSISSSKPNNRSKMYSVSFSRIKRHPELDDYDRLLKPRKQSISKTLNIKRKRNKSTSSSRKDVLLKIKERICS